MEQEYIQSLEIRIGYPSKTVTISGKNTVYYELHLANFSGTPLKPIGLKVLGEGSETPVFSLSTDELAARHRIVGSWKPLPEGTLSPGSASVIYMDFALPSKLKNKRLQHQFQLEHPDVNTNNPVTISGPTLELRETEITLGAEGVPFLLERFSLLGNYTDFSSFKKAPWEPLPQGKQSKTTEERPGPNSVIRF